jgi:heme exporter protein C
MYVHVPSAWISLFAYSIVFFSALISIIWHIKVYDLILLASCKLGAVFTLFTLTTGAIWGKPMWGTWWAWDARLTSELILFFIYISILLLHGSFEDKRKASTSVNILAIVGFINIPIIHFSVEWWNTLHQGPSVIKLSTPSIAGDMLTPLIITALGFTFFFLGAMLKSSQNMLLNNEKNKSWTKLV